MTDALDVVAIGNAIVDVVATADDGFLAHHHLAKGTMTLIDEATANRLYAAMGPGREVSGGSAANTAAALAGLGARAGYIGKVRDDQLGGIFAHDIGAAGVEFRTAPAGSGPSTARCLILVTPDAQRTMQTYLGACVHLGPADVDEELIASAKVVYLEGYLWDPPEAKAAFRKAIAIAHAKGRKVALSLSDPFCVLRHRDEFRELVASSVDLLFANEAEVMALYDAPDFNTALQQVRRTCPAAALTRSEKGSVIVADAEVHILDAAPVAQVVDTTGAGDAFAAGFLFGYTAGRDLATCARLGGLCAAEVISHYGARAEQSLAQLVKPLL